MRKGCIKNEECSICVCVALDVFFPPAIPKVVSESLSTAAAFSRAGQLFPQPKSCWSPLEGSKCLQELFEGNSHTKINCWYNCQDKNLCCLQWRLWNTAPTPGEGSQRWKSNFNSSLETGDPVLSSGAGCVTCLGLHC